MAADVLTVISFTAFVLLKLLTTPLLSELFTCLNVLYSKEDTSLKNSGISLYPSYV